MSKIGCNENYSDSPVHNAVASGDHDELRRILQSLKPLRPPSEIVTESDAIAEEEKADEISAVIDRRDVPNRETPLQLAVKLGDVAAAEMLMLAGANWTLQNEQGWNALQEAICNRQESIATVIYKHSKPFSWARWCRRLPRLLGAMRKMRDFYLEMTFHFESSVIPFISRIAPSDTYRIWKRGSNLRADLTLAGFDGFKIQRSDQSVLFLGEGSGGEGEEGEVLKRGSLCVVFHKDKEVVNAWDGSASEVKESEARRQVDAMLRTKVTRPGIDVSQAILVPQLTWRRQERSEMVGQWKAKVYDVHNVVFKVRSRQVSEANSNSNSNPNDQSMTSIENENEAYKELLTEDEQKQLELVLEMDSIEREGNVSMSSNTVDGVVAHHRRHSSDDQRAPNAMHSCSSDSEERSEKKGWFRSSKHHGTKKLPRLRSLPILNENVSNIQDLNSSHLQNVKDDKCSLDYDVRRDNDDDDEITRGMDSKKSSLIDASSKSGVRRKGSDNESEYRKGLRPVLWLSHDFPLRVEELFPLLDILANKVKAIRRLRELLATKLRPGTFPVKVAIPVVPTVQVLVTFTKFEELHQLDDFSTPPSSPPSEDASTTSTQSTRSSSSWRQWIRAPYARYSSSAATYPFDVVEDSTDPFALPPGYTWTTFEARNKKKGRNSRPRNTRAQGK